MTLLGPTNPPLLPIGQSDFAVVRRRGFTVVDKTAWIAEVLEDSANVLLVPRPRRFGKTLNLSMLRYFLEQSTENRRDLFLDTAIWGLEGGRYQAHFGRYPVIHLSFKDAKGGAWEDVWVEVRARLREMLRVFADDSQLIEAARLRKDERLWLEAASQPEASPAAMMSSLRMLSTWLERATGASVFILIDEYDAPLHAAWLHGYWDEAVAFFRGFLSSGLKDNPALLKGVLTGILRVAKEGIFSGLNHLKTASILGDSFVDSFGFTEREVETLAVAKGLGENLPQIREWYNGYRFGHTRRETVYNPWSVLSYLDEPGSGPRPFWKNTSDNALIRDLLVRHAADHGPLIESLLSGETRTVILDESVPLTELETAPSGVMSLFTFSGYLTVESVKTIAGNFECDIRIPNLEVRGIFEDTFRHWLSPGVERDGSPAVRSLVKALLSGDAESVEEQLEALLVAMLSYHDLGGERVEAVYQAFIVGMLVHLAATHRVYSNQESGFGRADVLIAPKSPGPGVVLELKRVTSKDTPERAMSRAIAQLVERNYSAGLFAAGATSVHQYAVVFDGKRCEVKSVPVGTV